MESVGFKEWALVCAALERGSQTILLRKGGIAEGRAGFSFKHREFYLFPTFFHEQADKTRSVDCVITEPPPGQIEVRLCARLEESVVAKSLEVATALEPFHILAPQVVQDRFAYDDAPGIHVAFVRVFRLGHSWILPDLPSYAGCRSWVELPERPEDITARPVLTDDEHRARLAEFRALVR